VNDTIKTIQQLRTVQPGIPIHTSYLHQHFAVIDQEILITGTNNWSDNGFLMNDESIIVTNIPFLVESFAEWWDRQYQALRGAKLIVQWENDRARLDPTQIIDAVSFQIYTESVAFGDQPALCFEASGAELSQTLKVPEFCRTPRNHAFLLDANGNILAGNYN
ncbi:MAG TPA: phospholipase D-like domain-containing protein, partial [Candidatus Peribacteraceae bacterium]|nr:phospholipase D-like domain-containing protein [Candidatus Peribacteraceae bacterium]